MEFLIEHPLRRKFENELSSGNLVLAGEMLRNDPDLGNYNYRVIMSNALEQGNTQTAEFLIDNKLDFSGFHYDYQLREALERGDFQTADFMVKKRLGLHHTRWEFISDDFKSKGNRQVNEWFRRNLFYMERANQFPNPAVRPRFKSENLNLLYEIEDAVKEKNPLLIRYLITKFPPDLFDTYTAKMLSNGKTDLLNIIINERPISENVLENALEEAMDKDDSKMIYWIRRHQIPTRENIEELKQIVNNRQFYEADRLLQEEPSLLNADLTDVFVENFHQKRYDILEYLRYKGFRESRQIMKLYDRNKKYGY